MERTVREDGSAKRNWGEDQGSDKLMNSLGCGKCKRTEGSAGNNQKNGRANGGRGEKGGRAKTDWTSRCSKQCHKLMVLWR